jgi:hypothetical protein
LELNTSSIIIYLIGTLGIQSYIRHMARIEHLTYNIGEPMMARTAIKSTEAVSQLATLPERTAALEVKVENINEKIDDIKTDMCANHDSIICTLKEMRDTSSSQHSEMSEKIKELEGFKNKWVRYAVVGLAFAAGAGWISNPSMGTLLKFVGL